MSQAVLELRNIARHYREGAARLDILVDINLSIFPGETVALVAPSGAGSQRCSISPASWSGRTVERRSSIRPRPR